MKDNHKEVLLLIIGIILLISVTVGLTYSFFNYAKTSDVTNTINMGTIYFNVIEEHSSGTLQNVFPVSYQEVIEGENTSDVFSSTLTIGGYTNYKNGIVYRVYINNIDISNISPNTLKCLKFIVTSDLSSNITFSPVTNLTGEDLINTDKLLLGTGHISKDTNTTLTKGDIIIKAYFDENLILISDTPESPKVIEIAGDRDIISTSEWNSQSLSFKFFIEAEEER